MKLCVQTRSQEEVAVKLLSEKRVEPERAEAEFNMLMSLQHEHLPLVYDLYSLHGFHAIVMEL